MAVPFKVNEELFRENYESDKRFLVNQGGTSSGKTYTIMQVLIVFAIMEAGCIITVVGQDLPNLRVGAFRDAKTIIRGSEWLSAFFKVNESLHYIQGRNGSVIEFNSYADEQDAKNGKRDYLFVNEANGVSYEIFWQLQIRTRKKVFMDYNPTSRFWVHDKIIGRKDALLIISTHRNNHFLSEEEHERIEGIEDDELWRVYARGLTGKLEGVVFTNWDIVDELPPQGEWKMSARGLDFGFTNDPSALERVVLAHGELWIDEELYDTGYTNPMLAKAMKEAGVRRNDIVIADCAEPKSIAEIKAEGIYIVPSVKGGDSINVGIDILKRYKIHITRRSKGLIENMQAYKWKKDRDGKRTNSPIDAYNHGIDAVRYVALSKLNIRRVGGVRAHYNEI
jgi:phage terminase large subunit